MGKGGDGWGGFEVKEDKDGKSKKWFSISHYYQSKIDSWKDQHTLAGFSRNNCCAF